jgi:predicted DNA-binding transcriptional regulator AlpA
MIAGISSHPKRIGISELESRLGISRVTVRRWYLQGTFPPPEFIGERRSWRVEVIEKWEAERLARPPEARRRNTNIVGPSNASAA